MATDHDTDKPYETRDLTAKPVVISLAVTAIVTIGCALAMVLMHNKLATLESSGATDLGPVAEERVLPPAPVLQADPPIEMAVYLEQQNTLVNGYGWINESKGKVHIPIEKAMEIVAEQGITAALNSSSPPVAAETH